jgi:virginiamycin B lyase
MRSVIAVGLCLLGLGGLRAAPPAKSVKGAPAPPAAPKAGIKTPGVQIPFESLKAEAQISVETPGWIAVGDSILVPNMSKDSVARIDPKTNKLLDPIGGVSKPCAGAISAFGAWWIPACGSQSVARFDAKANKVSATLSTGAAGVTMGLAATSDSVWMITDAKTTLTRIDPDQNKAVGEMRLPAGCNSVAFGENSLWVTCPSDPRILRINPATNLVDKRIEVSAGARSVAFGAGSVWVLCEKEGKVERIDPKTNRVAKTIDLAVPNAGGNLAFSDGFLWVTQTGFPLTRIDPETDKERVAQQFWGEGGGLISAAPGALWLSNTAKGSVFRLDPKRVMATLAE